MRTHGLSSSTRDCELHSMLCRASRLKGVPRLLATYGPAATVVERSWLEKGTRCHSMQHMHAAAVAAKAPSRPASWPSLPQHEHDAVFPPPPPPPSSEQPAWTDESWASPLDITRRIFCNRSLNMRAINAVGFDLDYTVAQYKPETFEVLAHTETVKKLVETLGYPKVLYDWKFDWRYMVRGLTIDKVRGNVLKIDKHKYVKIAYHGFKPLTREERLGTYSNSHVRFSFDEPDFAMIDTLFSLAEAHLFMQLVELHDTAPSLLPPGKDFPTMYRDVRAAVDLCHRDGSLKQAVAADPGMYVHPDLRLVPMLNMLRAAGKQLFVATNSQWDYTNVLMNFLLSGRVGKDKNEDWLEYFDVVVTGCGKPAFFEVQKPIFEVHTKTGLLQNTDGGAPMNPIGAEELPEHSTAPRIGHNSDRARVFQGGTYLDLHRMLGVTSGSQILYIGDHIYGDILRSKKTLGWRTCLVVPELERELRILRQCSSTMQELKALREQREALDDQIERLEWSARHSDRTACDEEEDRKLQEAQVVENLKEQRDGVRERHRAMLQHHHQRFHHTWGQLTKTGYANSRFAHQLERFACIYTSHVSNLSFYSPLKTFRAQYNIMSHEEEPGCRPRSDNP